MDSKILIAPSILSADFTCLGKEIKSVEKAGADWIHVDVMDGHFVPNLTLGPVVLHWIRKVTSLVLDVHLMIDQPEKYVEPFAKAGADSITFHCEAPSNPREVITLIRKYGKNVGVSLRPKTPLSAIASYLHKVDLVLIMTVEPGFGGQKFMPEMLPKIKELKSFIKEKNLSCKIEVDGGINKETGILTVKEGADILVAGNSIFSQKSRSNALKKIRSSVDKNG
ncbi:MAG: ribulose-phosphate 3-epimerase [Elusimicrobia bacterium RIFCSPLOWO2_02_FULL_39_32]|nr:MAG: ribulose-phosphate 3-epimerase [Elusimicrobia bacterium GWA2_38_7]OGR80333.1 MAG: ribulose-phosphate 3-epimerase [Elusimicrobia bacterium RIFCSPHIGHO2_02_FULL_39_36]OGR93627.1 MAG: ribulose-phosphate 3-epimerase [Elusimicrobia bacterium RIFCSPLOWO2_02_FULL_39_32]OGS00448.1 MAG: ribulose-phosphate 3-epimerase [Elusimicrobia bacterium RIFCSPLOWO2_12_FULL_39_28]